MIVLSSMSLAPIMSYAVPNSSSINVNQVGQEKSNWCWVACGKCIIAHFATFITQNELAIYVKPSLIPPNSGATLSEVKYGLAHWSVRSSVDNRKLTMNEIASEIATYHRPLIAQITYNSILDHDVVVRGYNISTNTILYMHPTYPGTFESANDNSFSNGPTQSWITSLYKCC